MAAEKVTLRIGVPKVSGDGIKLGTDFLQAALTKTLSGSADIKLVHQDSDPLDLLQTGAIDIAVVPSSSFASAGIKDLVSFDLPFLFAASDEVSAVQDSPVGQRMLSSLHYRGLVGLGYWNGGMSQLIGSPVYELKDLRGKTVCVQGIDDLVAPENKNFYSGSTSSVTAEAVLSNLGATAVTSKPSQPASKDIRSDCSQNTDAIEIAPLVIDKKQYKTPPSSVSGTGFRPIVFVLTMREDNWNKLTSRVQEALAREVATAASKVGSESDSQDAAAIASLKEKGFKVLLSKMDGFRRAESTWRSVTDKDQQDILSQIIPIVDEKRSAVAFSPQRHGDNNLGTRRTICASCFSQLTGRTISTLPTTASAMILVR